MNLSSPFINRPIATTLLSIGLALTGILAFNLLPVSSLPQVEFPTIMIQSALPGASPEIMASSVATPLEKSLSRIAGITDMTSNSILGFTTIIIQFDLSHNIDGAAREVQAAINAAASNLPANLPSPPTYRKVNPADFPILILALTSDHHSVEAMYDAASTILQQKLLQVNGVGQVLLGGSSLPAVRIELNPTKLNKYGISLNDIINAVNANNINLAKGQLTDGTNTYTLMTNDRLTKAKDFTSIIIRYNNGNPVRLSDVAEVIDSAQYLRNAGFFNGKPAIALAIFKQPGANVIQTVSNIKKIFPELSSTIKAGININIVMDRTLTIHASLRNVEMTLLTSMIFVILVVYVFLGNIRSMIIPSVALTLSILGTFVVMWLYGMSLNILSLMALTISTGFVVDDAIVVLENITRYLEKGMQPKEAALKGAAEIGFTVTSISISLIAVFIPILCMGGLIGRLFREFAITLSTAILVSLLISITLTPTMCAYLLKPKVKEKDSSFKKIFDRLKVQYAAGLNIALNYSKITGLIVVCTIALSIGLFIIVPKGFFPQQDTGLIVSSIVTDQNSSFSLLEKKLHTFMDIVQQDPRVQNVAGFASTANSGTMFTALVPLEKRKISSDAVIAILRNKLSNIPGATLYMQSAQDLVIGGRPGTAQFQYTISADNVENVNYYAEDIMKKLSGFPYIQDLNSDQRNHGLQVYVKVDYNRAASLGVTAQQVDTALYGAFGQSLISQIYTSMNQYYVVMEFAAKYLEHPEMLNQLYVSNIHGNLVPLSLFASFSESNTLLAINHQGWSPSATLSFNLLPGVPLGNAVNIINKVVGEMTLPTSVQGEFRGTAQVFQASLKNEPYLILAALVAVYIVLGMLYESLIHPITIISTLPSAGVGALLALFISNIDLSVIALIGIILLIGIVKKNAIMMIDFVISINRDEHTSPRSAIYEAANLRFRPIMMTTMAAMLGAVPMAFGTGVGSEMQRPLGIAIIGGLIVSQMLTLFTTPAVYLIVEEYKNFFQRKIWRVKWK